MSVVTATLDGRELLCVRCDHEGCNAAVIGFGTTEAEETLSARTVAARNGWQTGTTEVPVDLCPKHVVIEKQYVFQSHHTRLFGADGYSLNPLLPRVGSDGRPLRSKKS